MDEIFPISDVWFYWTTIGLIAVIAFLFHILGYDVRNAPAYVRRNGRWLGFNTLLLLVAAHLLLLAPAPPAGSHCVDIHHVGGPLRVVLSCDSYDFIRAARHPGWLSMPESYRQGRPIQTMVASLLTLIEAPSPNSRAHEGSAEFDAALSGGQTKGQGFLGYPYGFRLHGWFAFVILNFVTLLVALMLFRSLIAPADNVAVALVAVLGVFIAFSDVVKGFFWSAHTQMWNVLMPLIAIALSNVFLKRPAPTWSFMAASGSLLGIGILTYASFIVCVAVVFVSMAAGFWMNRQRPNWPALFGKVTLFLSALAAPSLIWVGTIKKVTGSFAAPEVRDFRQFVWIIDSWKEGGAPALQRKAGLFFSEFGVHVWNELWPVLILFLIVLLFGLISREQLTTIVRGRSRLLIAAVITLLMCLPFFALMGFYRDRLAFNVAVPVFVIASVLLTGLLENASHPRRALMAASVVLAGACSIASALLRITWPY